MADDEEFSLSKKDVQRGVSSLVDKCRKLKATEKMKDKRHEKYLEFASQAKIQQEIIDKITSASTNAMNQKAKKLQLRKNPKNFLFKNRKPKKKNTSVFSDEDFAKVAGASHADKMKGFERIR